MPRGLDPRRLRPVPTRIIVLQDPLRRPVVRAVPAHGVVPHGVALPSIGSVVQMGIQVQRLVAPLDDHSELVRLHHLRQVHIRLLANVDVAGDGEVGGGADVALGGGGQDHLAHGDAGQGVDARLVGELAIVQMADLGPGDLNPRRVRGIANHPLHIHAHRLALLHAHKHAHRRQRLGDGTGDVKVNRPTLGPVGGVALLALVGDGGAEGQLLRRRGGVCHGGGQAADHWRAAHLVLGCDELAPDAADHGVGGGPVREDVAHVAGEGG
mmetsp:Transcript_15321/g.33794  ORF Transcript_15321/g.33794 Transcript_15321/m.33794 type:complete len:268 (-) Transcript_15321:4144-4947(-)